MASQAVISSFFSGTQNKKEKNLLYTLDWISAFVTVACSAEEKKRKRRWKMEGKKEKEKKKREKEKS